MYINNIDKNKGGNTINMELIDKNSPVIIVELGQINLKLDIMFVKKVLRITNIDDSTNILHIIANNKIITTFKEKFFLIILKPTLEDKTIKQIAKIFETKS